METGSVVYIEQLDMLLISSDIHEIGAKVEVKIGDMNLGSATVVGHL